MNKYDSYKPSGVKWLGQIPSHWEVLPGLAVFQENKEKNNNLAVNTVLSLSYGKIVVKKDIDEGLVPAEYNTYQIVHPGYIIIRCTDLQNDKVSLRTGLVKDDGIITGAYLGLVTNGKYNSSYIHYFLHAWDITKDIYRHGNGLRQSLSWLDLRRLPILIPPIAEQTAIANYLGTATSKIDAAIAQQQKMIDLLNERKQIIINRAVTKGLNPNAKMKDSGVEWIGEIPDGWFFLPGKSLYHENKVKNKNNEETNVLSLSYGKIIRKKELVEGLQPENYNSYQIVEPNYIIIRCTDLQNDHTSLRIGLVKERGIITGAYLGLIPHGNIIPSYLHLFLHVFDITKEIYRYGSGTRQSLNWVDFKNLPILIPSPEEQESICKYVNDIEAKINKQVFIASNQISLLQERKQIIINEVVTGKVKVV